MMTDGNATPVAGGTTGRILRSQNSLWDGFLLALHQNLSGQLLFILSIVMAGDAYFFMYPQVPPGDRFMISLVIARLLFRWIGILSLFAIAFYLYRIYTTGVKAMTGEVSFIFGETEITYRTSDEEHTLQYRYVTAVRKTWSAFLIEVDGVARFILPNRHLSADDRAYLVAFADRERKLRSSYRLAVTVLLFLVATPYYLWGKGERYYYLRVHANPFDAAWTDTELFIASTKTYSGHYLSYTDMLPGGDQRTEEEQKNDEPTGPTDVPVLWIFADGTAAQVTRPGDREDYGRFMTDQGTMYWISHDREKEEPFLFRWDREQKLFVLEPKETLKQITKRQRAEWKKRVEAAQSGEEEADIEESRLHEGSLIRKNKDKGPRYEKTLTVGDDRYTIVLERDLPYSTGTKEPHLYRLSVVWEGSAGKKPFAIQDISEGERQVSREEYLSVMNRDITAQRPL